MLNNIRNFLLYFKSKRVLGFVSFIESIFFPIPTDVFLIPMVLSKSYKWQELALLTTLTSVLGGAAGYFIGLYLYNEIYPYILQFGYEEELVITKEWFVAYGVMILFISSFTPLPYKIFTITAGFLSINIILFIVISFFGRGLRFYLVAYLTDIYGAYIIDYLNKYFLYISAALILIFVVFKL
tara:strand:+ start:447 stop:995 length:549 start_codon:yes stop_codon:yes gene_type:complete